MKTKIQHRPRLSFFVFLLILLCTEALFAMGSKKPSPNPTPIPAPVPVPTPAPIPAPINNKPTLDFGENLESDAFLNSASEIGPQIDDSVGDDELMGVAREKANENEKVDQCFNDSKDHTYFSNQISYYAQEMIEDVPPMVGFIGSLYGTSSNDQNYFPTSLIRHPLCIVNSTTLSKTMNKVPGNATIEKLNRFASEINGLRQNVLDGDRSAKVKLLSTWSRMFSCLAYAESLSTADSAASKSVAQRVAPSGYRKPAGVKFYDDPAQSEASRLNIGMFQFTPNSGGNIQPCLKAWNAIHRNKPQCQVNTKANQGELIKILGSSLQSFNAFCGIHKLIQTFAIQVNTSKTSATFPTNLVNGKLKPNELRCVTPHFQAGKAYNHFGPFQNSTGSNLEKLFSCIERSR